MDSSRRFRYGGLVVALSGFGITRLFVAETLQVGATLPFVVAGLLPLVVGLALTVYGVALAIGPFASEYVNTVARWHVLGVGSMGVVFAITAADRLLRGGAIGLGHEAPLLVGNVLLGGAVGGTLTGIRTGRINRQRRAIRRSANRGRLVNRLLRHEVLNAVTIIGGHTDLLQDGDPRPESVAAIRAAVRRIDSTIEEVGALTRNGDRPTRVDVGPIVREAIARVESDHGIDVRLSVHADDTEIAADERVETVVHELLENAVAHGAGGVAVELEETPHTVSLSVLDAGPGLPEPQRAFLEGAEFPDADDPTAGFGHQIVRLLVLQFGGTIRVRTPGEDGEKAGVTVVFPRRERRPGTATAESVGLSFPNIHRALAGGILGGIAMGAFYQLSTGLLPVIGSLYGIQSPVVGWVTHLFHSAVFGLLFAAICAGPRIGRLVSGPVGSGLIGMGWGTALWLVAAGTLMPIWLSALGVPAEIPTLSLAGFVGHALWGVTLGVTYWYAGRIDAVDRLRPEGTRRLG